MRKPEKRQAIIENVMKNKNSIALGELLEISDLLYRYMDNNEYQSITDEEYDRISLIGTILHLKDATRLRRRRQVANAMENRR